MKRLFGYVRKNIWYYIAALLFMNIAIVLDMFYPRILRSIIDDVIIGSNTGILKHMLSAFIGITAARTFLGYAKEYTFDVSSSRLVFDIRKDLFEHIQKLSFNYFDGMNTGELMSRVKEDVDNVWNAFSFGIMLFIENTIYFVVAATILFSISWKLALISMLTLPIIAYLAVKLEKKIKEAYAKISDQRALINTTAQENLAGVRLVKAFGREKYEINKFLDQNNENCRLNVRRSYIYASYYPKIEMLSNLVSVLVTTIGGFLVIREEMSIGQLVAFSNYVFMLISPMRMIGWLINLMAECKASLKKIEGIFNEEPVVKNPEVPVKPENFEGHVVFENVSFEYNGSTILKNINIDAKPGSTIAVMGMTGSGKSSIVNLIGRYYDCTEGNVLVDGINVKDMDLGLLRKQVSTVMQDVFLFSDTIEENIKLGCENADRNSVVNASDDACVSGFTLKMEDGYDTIIGERGVGLSGGQKQRISIARALVRDSHIIIFDDATSALDMETEYEIQKAIEERKHVTKFIIAHRISAVKNADEILYIDGGCVIERGTHSQLLERKGRYYEIYCEQFKGLIIDEEEKVV